MNIFLNNYYNNNIRLINNKYIYNNLKKSYFGGITEVYKPYGKNLYYYDVNSIYPYSALKPMPGLNSVYGEFINKDINELKYNLFGLFYCSIKASNNYIGLLPHRSDSGLIMPIGEWDGWYFSEQLKFAFEQGYKIQVMSGYHFDKVENVFSNNVNYLYNKKWSSKDSVQIKIVFKELFLNHF